MTLPGCAVALTQSCFSTEGRLERSRPYDDIETTESFRGDAASCANEYKRHVVEVDSNTGVKVYGEGAMENPAAWHQ